MEPLCKEGDFVLLDKLFYVMIRPKAGDTVVLKHPQQEKLLLKYVLREKTDGARYFYWVEGLNKMDSLDSRNFGWVPRNMILGRAIVAKKQEHTHPALARQIK